MKLRINEGPSDKLYKENHISQSNMRSRRDTSEINFEFQKLSTTVFVDNSVSEDVGETVNNKSKISIRKVIGSIGIIFIVTGCLILGISLSFEDENLMSHNDESDQKVMQKPKNMEVHDDENPAYDDYRNDFLQKFSSNSSNEWQFVFWY